MSYLIIPVKIRVFQIELLRVRKRPHRQIKIVAIVCAVVEVVPLLRGIFESRTRLEKCIETEIRLKHKRAVVVRVVTHIKVRYGGLRRTRFQRRMRVRHPSRHIKSRIRNPVNSSFAVVVGNIFQEPGDRVVRVGAFVDILRPFFCILMRRHFDERAFALKAAANVLVNKNEAVRNEASRRAKAFWIIIRPVRADAVRRAFDQKWIRF